jgi:hypothetical protein
MGFRKHGLGYASYPPFVTAPVLFAAFSAIGPEASK